MDEKVKKWIIKAMEDFKTIEHELSFPEEEIPTGIVCFHAQQFVEKLLKAYLTWKKIDFGKTHNLEFLLTLCKKVDNEFINIEIGDLTFYAVEIRYPDEFYIPTLKEAKESYELAKKIKEFIFKKLNITEKDLSHFSRG